MRKNNGRRRLRGHTRKNYNNINRNTVLESSGPTTQVRGNALQLTEKYSSLASDAAANDDKVLAEAFLQFADHYHRLNRDIESSHEAKSTLVEKDKNVNLDDKEIKDELINQDVNKDRPSRKERSLKAIEEEKEFNKKQFKKLPKKFINKENLDKV